jgi:TPR repeat protein
MYGNGQGVAQDDKEAARWFRLAAHQGEARAQYTLGAKYFIGVGVLQNNVLAHMWINIGTANGYENGSKLRDRAASKMTPSDISKAQELARICLNSAYRDCGQ